MANRIRHLLSELRRRKVYHVAVVYVAVGLGVAQGADWLFSLMELPTLWARAAAVIVLLGFPIALVLAWAFEIKPESPPPEEDQDKAPVTQADSERSIAVLPFESFSSDPEGDYFADGITEELTNALARQKGLRVAARTSAFAFKGERRDIREIGQALNVSHVIEGSVRRSDQALRITAQLIDTRDGFHLWSDQFDRELGDVFRIQEEIAGCVVEGLLDDEQEGTAPSIATTELSAYDSFLKGRYQLAKFEPDSISEAIRHFELAIQLDDRFAPALAGLAEALTLQSIGFSERPTQEIMPRAAEVALKAITLDARLPEAHLARALSLMYWDWDFAGAKGGFDRAIELNPNFVEAHLWMEFYWTYVEHDFEEAVAANGRAQRLSPLDTRVRGRLATVHYLFGNLEEAERLLLEELSDTPDNPLPHLSMADTLVRMGRVDEGVSHMETAVRLGGRPNAFLGMLCGFYGLQGARERATAVLEELEGRHAQKSVPGFWMAVAYAGLGRLDEAFASLDRGVEERDSNLVYLIHTPRAFRIQEDPRFPPILEKVGLGHLSEFV